MAFFNLRVVAVLLAVAVVTVEPSLRRRQRCHPQVKYITQIETKYQELQIVNALVDSPPTP
ncbi:hypothetical protein E2C01_033695 [Portunus trituberculatus]|uniref:Uncharacterized protein n=1 Tax=Portunus trituberculatus TaxID=210409 RepID=A0A5B7EYK1_PORTR|nr:hypothetical protein [Portunus trituberculatus]